MPWNPKKNQAEKKGNRHRPLNMLAASLHTQVMATFRYLHTFIDEAPELKSELTRSRPGSKSCPQLGGHQSPAKKPRKTVGFFWFITPEIRTCSRGNI